MKRKLAIIGTGIAGLGCAHWLQHHYELTLFDGNPYVGGHSNTVIVPQANGQQIPIDTGFMVFNTVTYPLLNRLFEQLGVAWQNTDMSFSVQLPALALEWAGASWGRLFAQRRNLLSPRYWRFLLELNRFNQQATQLAASMEGNEPASIAQLEQPMSEFLKAHHYSDEFTQWYLLPMASAIWSSAPDKILAFPARTLIRFFRNHGFLGMDTQYQWRTVTGGSKEYVQKLTAPFAQAIYKGHQVNKVEVLPAENNQNQEESVVLSITPPNGLPYQSTFDALIIAAHADEALALLAQPTSLQHKLLSPFGYAKNTATLHSDVSVMPKRKAAWASWNYRLRPDETSGNTLASTHYWMNQLQALPTDTPYFVTINDAASIAPDKIHQTLQYTHPIFTVPAIQAQAHLPQLNQHGPVYFAGSYFKYGFHEDALGSAYQLCTHLLGADPWTASL